LILSIGLTLLLLIADVALRRPSRAAELKRRQATAVVLMGVLGAEFGQDTDDQKRKSGAAKSTIEGFAIGANQNLARLTSNSKILRTSQNLLLLQSYHKILFHLKEFVRICKDVNES